MSKEEHIFIPLAGSTAVRCSCGEEFNTSAEAEQHKWWQLQLAIAFNLASPKEEDT